MVIWIMIAMEMEESGRPQGNLMGRDWQDLQSEVVVKFERKGIMDDVQIWGLSNPKGGAIYWDWDIEGGKRLGLVELGDRKETEPWDTTNCT